MNDAKSREYFAKFTPYEAQPAGPTTRLDEIAELAVKEAER